jgi:hypothetical protein
VALVNERGTPPPKRAGVGIGSIAAAVADKGIGKIGIERAINGTEIGSVKAER